jgi:tetratricopeptide (TPR) repeat protein
MRWEPWMSDRAKVPNLILRAVRENERQETRAEFAEAMERKARELGEAVAPSERYVARLEDGDVRYPHPAYRRVLSELCGRSPAELGFTTPITARRILGKDAPLPLLGIQKDSGIALPSLQEIEAVRRNLDATVSEGSLSEASIEDWENTAIQYGRTTRYESPDVLIADLTADLSELNDLLSRCRSASAIRRLTIVAAQMAGLMCLTLVKMDDRVAFRRWARTARVAAEEAGDPQTFSWVRAQEAYGHYYSGDYSAAIDIARHAQDVAKGIPCVGAALAAALEARAQACLGPVRQDEAQEALSRAEMILSRLESESIACSAFGYNEAQLQFHAGNVYTNLRNSRLAQAAQERALEIAPENDYTDRALTNLDRAICLAYDGDGFSATSYAISALTGLTTFQRQGIISARASQALNALPGPQKSLPAAQEIKELIALSDDTRTEDREW